MHWRQTGVDPPQIIATSNKVQGTRGARVAAVHGLINVMCTPLLYTMRHVTPRRWEEVLRFEVGRSPVKCSRINFLRNLIEDVQTRFNGTHWDDSATAEDWVESSSCSCERVFNYVTATHFGQSTERMCDRNRGTASAGMRAVSTQTTFKTGPVCHNKLQRARSIFTCVHALVDAVILAVL